MSSRSVVQESAPSVGKACATELSNSTNFWNSALSLHRQRGQGDIKRWAGRCSLPAWLQPTRIEMNVNGQVQADAYT